jgi:hypothetical protein
MKIKLRFTQTKSGLLLMVLFFSSFGRGQMSLPFTYDLGKPISITGIVHTGLGSDYTTSPKMKFDTTSDELILSFNSQPGTLSFVIKWNQSTSVTSFPGDFTLQESNDGNSYSTVQLYNATNGNALSNGTSNTETFTTLNVATRFIKWIYTSKSNGNIALGAISLSAAPTSSTWNGTTWSNGIPTASLDAIIDGTYTTTTNGVFSAKTLTVNTGKSFSISSGHSIAVAGAITNNGSFTVQNNANLIQTNTTAVTNTGNIIVNRNSALIQLYDYTLWSSPVAGQQLQAFSPNTLSTRFYTYDSTQGTNGLYSAVPTPSATNFATATGYLIRAPNTWTAATPTTFNGVFTGVPNNGDVTISGLIAGKYHAVGNPYPSTISVADFYTENPNAGTLYFWRKTNGVAGSAYATRNSAGTTAASGGLTPTADIAVGQGFFVSPSANMTLNFTNAMRATPSNSAVFLRTTEERNRFWLNLTNTSGLFSQMLVGYIQEATSGVDNAIDGRYINDAPTALTSLM